MRKLIIAVALVVAAVQFLPMEMVIVLGCIPFGLGIGLPVARGVQAFVASR